MHILAATCVQTVIYINQTHENQAINVLFINYQSNNIVILATINLYKYPQS